MNLITILKVSMDFKLIFEKVEEFCKDRHGSSNYHTDDIYVMGKNSSEFAPWKFLCKKIEGLEDVKQLLQVGFAYDPYDVYNLTQFQEWYEKQFGSKLPREVLKKTCIIHMPNNKAIFDMLERVNKAYEVLREQMIILNGKNLPTQLGEWYAKCIFGLRQNKSTSQRGFDFYLGEKRVEVNVHWSDYSSPKGVKVKKSLIDLSDYCVVMYLATNFTIREICFLDSEYVSRKFSTKGHTIFLKDSDLQPYFFSKSDKHLDKVVNPLALLKFASPMFAMKLVEHFPNT